MLRAAFARNARLNTRNLRNSSHFAPMRQLLSPTLRLPGSHRALTTAHPSHPQAGFPEASLGKCPSCAAPLLTPLPVCPICEHIEPIPKDMSYHQVMGLDYEPNPFQVEHPTLRARFLALQRLVHPDRWAAKSPIKGDIAARVSEAVNTINSHLSNPFLRAAYILEREGITDNPESILDNPAVVMEVMEVREALEEAQTEEEVEEIRVQNKANMNDVQEELSEFVAAKAWDRVSEAAIRLKYLQGIEQAARAWPNRAHDH